jgi:hypothetical protein
VGWTLYEGTEGKSPAIQPVQSGDVGPHVAAHEDHALAPLQRGTEAPEPVHVEAVENRGVRSAVEGIVAG